MVQTRKQKRSKDKKSIQRQGAHLSTDQANRNLISLLDLSIDEDVEPVNTSPIVINTPVMGYKPTPVASPERTHISDSTSINDSSSSNDESGDELSVEGATAPPTTTTSTPVYPVTTTTLTQPTTSSFVWRENNLLTPARPRSDVLSSESQYKLPTPKQIEAYRKITRNQQEYLDWFRSTFAKPTTTTTVATQTDTRFNRNLGAIPKYTSSKIAPKNNTDRSPPSSDAAGKQPPYTLGTRGQPLSSLEAERQPHPSLSIGGQPPYLGNMRGQTPYSISSVTQPTPNLYPQLHPHIPSTANTYNYNAQPVTLGTNCATTTIASSGNHPNSSTLPPNVTPQHPFPHTMNIPTMGMNQGMFNPMFGMNWPMPYPYYNPYMTMPFQPYPNIQGTNFYPNMAGINFLHPTQPPPPLPSGFSGPNNGPKPSQNTPNVSASDSNRNNNRDNSFRENTENVCVNNSLNGSNTVNRTNVDRTCCHNNSHNCQNNRNNSLDTSSVSSSSVSNQTSVSLPRIKIDSFDGDLTQYKEFKIKIKSMLAISNYSEEMKVIFLKGHLTGEPAETVASIMPDDPGAYENIWLILDEDFGSPELGFDHHLNLLLSLSSWSRCETDEDIKQLYRHISINYEAIKHFGPEAAKEAEAAKVLILPLLFGTAAHKVTKLHETGGNNYNIPAILKILKSIIGHNKFLESSKALKVETRRTNKPSKKSILLNKNLESNTNTDEDDTDVRSNLMSSGGSPKNKRVAWEDRGRRRAQSPSPERNSDRVPRYVTPTRSPSPAQFACPFCQSNDHDKNTCKRFDNRDLYWALIIKNRWCGNCLRTGHRWRDCFRESSCDLACGRADKHVSVLCDKYYKK